LKETHGLTIASDSPQEIVDFFIKEFNYEDLCDILTAMNGGASYEARFAVVGSASKEVCSSR
jgi:hypothetical protein